MYNLTLLWKCETPAMDDDAELIELVRLAQAKAIRRRRRSAADGKTTRKPRAQPARLSPSQRQGRHAESLACEHVRDHGMTILARNLSCKAGEIDLVAKEREILVFIEVRQRRSSRFGGAAASVNRNKQRRLALAAAYFLPRLAKRHFGGAIPACRFDLICIDAAGMTWIRQAFYSQARTPARS